MDIANLHTEAQRLLNRGELAPARDCCLRILQQDPLHADAHFLLGMIAAAGGSFSRALEDIDRAIAMDGRNAEYHAQRARCLAVLKRESEAGDAGDKALSLGPQNALTFDTIGVVFTRTGRHREAATAYRQAVAMAPENPGFQFNLGAALQILGEFDQAQSAYEAAIAAAPRFYRAHSALSRLWRQTPDSNHIQRLEALLPGIGDDVNGELLVRHALAKEYECLGDYSRAFEHLAAGNDRKRRTLDYHIDRDRVLFETLERLCGEDMFRDAPHGHDSDDPIFVVGMPRTGTTLVERILSSHSGVVSAGELQDFGIGMKRAAGTGSREVLDVETLERARDLDFTALGRSYVDGARRRVGDSLRFVDKMPLNFFYIGFIARALPRAKIICLRRHPLDTCLSNFRQLFAVDFSYYNYAYSLEDTARYYLLFDGLMRHWQRVLPGKVLEVHYEELVQDPETQSRHIVEYCGLEWEDACLAFDRNPAPVASASSVQVRQPLYRDAIGRWRHYEVQLAPARSILEAGGLVSLKT
jgi:tetratricopeptide (TPR) repeat protein